MLNEEVNLSHKIFSKNIDEEPLRDGYGKGLLEIGVNKNVVVLTADLEDSTRCRGFRQIYPERFIEVGVAEQNMIGIASGLGVSGKIPFVNSYAVFSPGRNWEQIRTTCAYNDSNVKIIGHHCGLLTGPDGATHQSLEDIALMRVIPNMKVIVPCDSIEARKATVAISQVWGPNYLRLSREKTPIITTNQTPFLIGKVLPLWVSKKNKPEVLMISSGPITYNTLLAAKELEKEKIGSVVLNCATIKPLDEKGIIAWARKIGAVVSVEEHSIIGGLGSALGELFLRELPLPMEFVGTQDVFGQSGNPYELWKKYHLDVKDIIYSAKKAIRRK